MKYEITLDKTEEGMRTSVLVGEHIGAVRLEFRNGDILTEHSVQFVYVSTFLRELSRFLREVVSKDIATWDLGYAPFAFGRMRGCDLCISHQSGEKFEDQVFDIISASDLHKVQEKLNQDMRMYDLGADNLKIRH